MGIPGDVFSYAEDPDQYKCHLFLSYLKKEDSLESYSKKLHEDYYCDHDHDAHT